MAKCSTLRRLGVIGLVALGGIVSIAGCGSSASNSGSATSPTSAELPTDVPTALPSDTAPAQPPVDTTTTQAPSTPQVLLQISGNGINNTQSFTTGDTWSIKYTYDCSAFGTQGNMTIYVDYPNGDIAANELGSKGGNTTTETGAGTHTLKIASECSWTVEVDG